MQIGEFIEATARLEEYYGKEYTKQQMQIMFDELSHLDIARYRKLISAVLRKCKYLPRIVDFIEADKEEPYNTNETKEAQEKIDCPICGGTGYVIYKKKIKDGDRELIYDYAAICRCGNSKQYKGWEIQDTKHRSNYYIPYADELGI